MDHKRIFGMDIGGTEIKIGLFDGEGNLLEKWSIPTDRTDGGCRILADAAASLLAKMRERGLGSSDVIGVGVGVPGVVLPDGTVERAVNLGWGRLDAAGELTELLDGIPAFIGNDANAAALGEAWKGAGKGRRSIVLVTLGTGLGAGVIIDGKMITGAHGVGGEIGHMRVRDDEKEPCTCGGYGCSQQICSATGLVREAERLLSAEPEAESVLRTFGSGLTARDIADAAKEGDRIAEKTMDIMTRYLGRTLALTAMVVDPEVFILGGGVSAAGSYLTERTEKYYKEYSPISEYRADVVTARLGNDAGIYGAAAMAGGFGNGRTILGK
ncbi:ROK family glucokinase [[Clostridium] aminophilum]|nr:ROK family glucokinase [[Clostridium] aminophilum]